MTMIQIDCGRTQDIEHTHDSPTSLLHQLIVAMIPKIGVSWHTLNDRLLRDIGKSTAEAEVAKLRGSLGCTDVTYSGRLPFG